MLKILAHRGSFPSGIRLRMALQQISGTRVLATRNVRSIKPGKPFIRYGNSEQCRGKDLGFNPQRFVNLSSNKLQFSRLMNDNGIMSPEFHGGSRPRNDDYPVIIRTIIQGSGGRGIIVARNEQEFNRYFRRGYYWTRFHRTQFEIRVHLLMHSDGTNEIARIFRKEGEDGDFPIRTNDHYEFRLRDTNTYAKAIPTINSVADAIREYGAKFCALDMGWNTELKRYIVFESNSAPGLNDNTATVYAQFLISEGVL